MVYSDEKEQIRKKLFLPLYYTVISLLVPLSLWVAWGIYRQPLRYRSLFPHNEARRQAIAGIFCHSPLFLSQLYNFPSYHESDRFLYFIRESFRARKSSSVSVLVDIFHNFDVC